MKWNEAAFPVQWKQLWEKYKYVLLVILVGVMLMVIPSRGDTTQSAQSGETEQTFQTEELEQKLGRALSQIEGAGEVTVVLTLQSGSRQILAQDVQTEQTKQKKSTVILSQGSGVEQAVVLQQIAPQYQGALVVCEGGADPEVKLQVLNAVRALTGLNSDKISICKRK